MSSSKLLEKQALEKERNEVLQQLEDWLETPMLVLGFIWLALFIVEIIWGLNPLLEAVSITIWIIFILDFLLKLAIAPHKISYIKSSWLTAISLFLPALRTFRIIRVIRILASAAYFSDYPSHSDTPNSKSCARVATVASHDSC